MTETYSRFYINLEQTNPIDHTNLMYNIYSKPVKLNLCQVNQIHLTTN